MSEARDFSSSCYCTVLRKATRSVTKFYDAALEPSGLRITQYALLNHVRRLGPISLHALSSAIKLERTTLLRNLNLLLKQGLVRITPGKPAKIHLVELTEKGEALLQATRPLWEETQKKVGELFDSEERAVLRIFLQRLEDLVP